MKRNVFLVLVLSLGIGIGIWLTLKISPSLTFLKANSQELSCAEASKLAENSQFSFVSAKYLRQSNFRIISARCEGVLTEEKRAQARLIVSAGVLAHKDSTAFGGTPRGSDPFTELGDYVPLDTPFEFNGQASYALYDNGWKLELFDPKSGGRIYKATEIVKMAKDGNTEQLRQLISQGIQVNLKDEQGNTPLYWAVCQGNAALTKILLDAGANPDEKNASDSTALMCAAHHGHTAIARMLLSKGTNANARDVWGRNARRLARENRKTDMVELLKNAGAED